jgi:hypothetical protein
MNKVGSIPLTALLLIAFQTAACGSSVPPTVPSVVASTPPAPQVFTRIEVYVEDAAFRPLAEVTVDLIDQSQTVAAVSDANGLVLFSGSFVGPVTLRATKDGYVGASQTVTEQSLSRGGGILFFLGTVAAPVKIETGNYTFTFVADRTCTDLPDNVRTRTYAANIAPGQQSGFPTDTQYYVSVAGTTSWCCSGTGGFGIGVAGNYVAITDDTSPEMREQLPGSDYLELDGWGGTSIETPTVSMLSFFADLKYCAMGGSCVSCAGNSRITLTRR